MNNNDLAPICIASPVRRSGTTLLQRLLCSASNGLIYGESCANDLFMLSNLFLTKQSYFEASKDWRNGQLRSVLEGDVNDWIPDLMPDIDGYLDAYKTAVISLVAHYGNFARQQGRTVWGMKLPEWHPVNLAHLHKLLPASKVIFLKRNLIDCVKSAKKLEMVNSLEELQHFCQIWKQYVDLADKHLKGDWVLPIDYEMLVTSPDETLNIIESFTGAVGIDRSVMKVKINTFNNDEKLDKEAAAYLEPALLSDGEMDVIESIECTSVI